MRLALSLAFNGKYLTSPNPMVGCVITKDNKIIGQGWHEEFGGNHAEINAINDVKKQFGKKGLKLLEGSSIYTSLEPCSKKGKTGSCANELIKYKVAKVVVASKDLSQDGISILKKNGIKVEESPKTIREEAEKLNRGFFKRIKSERPFVTCKIGMSLDGGIALETGESKWITSEDSRKDVHQLRAESDAILTGIGTIIKDDPKLTSRDIKIKKFNQPIRCVIDGKNRIIGTENIVDGKVKTIIFCKEIPRDLIPSIEYVKTRSKKNFLDLEETLKWLGNKKINSVLIESGPRIITSLLNEGLIDEFIFYIAPKILGKNRINFLDFVLKGSKLGKIKLIKQGELSLGKDLKIICTPVYS